MVFLDHMSFEEPGLKVQMDNWLDHDIFSHFFLREKEKVLPG